MGLFVLRHDSYAISRQSASSLVFCTGSNIRMRLATSLEEAFVEMSPSSAVQTLPPNPEIRNREKQLLDW